MMESQLPVDVVLEILSYMPAKSVVRFRAVSRSWREALSSPFFVDLHLRHANRTAPKLFCGPADFEAPLDDDRDNVSLDSGDPDDDKAAPRDNDDPAADEVSVEFDSEWRFYAVRVGGGGPVIQNLMRDKFPDGMPVPLTKPLRGLILVRCFNNGGYYVCNPCTGAVLDLPDSTLPMKTMSRSSRAKPPPPFFPCVSYGLGYCAVTGKYKVFRLFTCGGDDNDEACCEVFVLDAPAYWRPTARKPPQGCSVGEENPAVFLNGSLHYLCRDGEGVVTLNVGDESFGSLPAPAVDEEIVATITELDGRLCVCQRARESGEGPYHLWLYGGDETARWEKLCCIDPSSWPEDDRKLLRSRLIAPLCMYGEEKIMLRTGTSRVFAVDPAGGVAGAPEILFRPDEHEATDGEFEDTTYPTLGLYEESLVPVGRTIDEMVFSSPATRAWSDVLKWLPARTVADLSLVCREWRAIVASDRFVRAHAAHPKIATSTRVRFVMDPTFGLSVDVDRVGEVHDPDISIVPFVCVQPCRGLNAGSFLNMDFVCNPTVGYYENLILDDDDDERRRDDIFLARIALGYDEEEDDHVLVRLAYTAKNLEARSYQLRCRMRFVREGLWFPRPTPPPRPVASATPAYANGKIYWLVDPALTPPPEATSPTLSPACELVALDCHDAAACRYEVVQGPPCHPGRGRVSILQLRGALCVACSDRDANTIDVWSMKNDDSNAWSMEHHLELAAYWPDYSSEKTTVMGVDPTSGRIWLNTGQSLGHYDPKTGELLTVYRGRNQYPNTYYGRFCAVICQESLIRYAFRRRLYTV